MAAYQNKQKGEEKKLPRKVAEGKKKKEEEEGLGGERHDEMEEMRGGKSLTGNQASAT